jgi:hypothetical protein
MQGAVDARVGAVAEQETLPREFPPHRLERAADARVLRRRKPTCGRSGCHNRVQGAGSFSISGRS